MFSPGLVLISEVCPCSWLRICFDFSACDIFINTSPFFQIPCSSREPSLSCAQLGWGVGGCRGGCRESWPGNIHPLSRLHPVELINSFSIVGFPAGEALRGIRVSRFRGLRPHGVFTPRSPHGPPPAWVTHPRPALPWQASHLLYLCTSQPGHVFPPTLGEDWDSRPPLLPM